MTLDSQIEAALFWRGEPITIKKLSAFVEKSEEEVLASLNILEERLKNGGLRLIRRDDEVMISTAPSASSLIEKMTKEELVRDLGKAGLETLSIVLYKGPVARREIDYIRGVNSTFILRNLQIRGLVEKVTNKDDQRSFLYKPTFELLSFLGVSKIEDLPEYIDIKKELEDFNKASEEGSEDNLNNKEIMKEQEIL